MECGGLAPLWYGETLSYEYFPQRCQATALQSRDERK